MLVSNGSVQVKVQSTVAATLALLVKAGVKIGKTSLSDLIAGRKETACGFSLVEEVVVPANKGTKSEIAQSIFDANFGEKSPKEIKNMFIEQAGLTERGANTYYYNMKSKAGL